MQVSLYLDEKVVKKIDERARHEQRSRSSVIQQILEAAVGGESEAGSAEAILDEIRQLVTRGRRAAGAPPRRRTRTRGT